MCGLRICWKHNAQALHGDRPYMRHDRLSSTHSARRSNHIGTGFANLHKCSLHAQAQGAKRSGRDVARSFPESFVGRGGSAKTATGMFARRSGFTYIRNLFFLRHEAKNAASEVQPRVFGDATPRRRAPQKSLKPRIRVANSTGRSSHQETSQAAPHVIFVRCRPNPSPTENTDRKHI